MTYTPVVLFSILAEERLMMVKYSFRPCSWAMLEPAICSVLEDQGRPSWLEQRGGTQWGWGQTSGGPWKCMSGRWYYPLRVWACFTLQGHWNECREAREAKYSGDESLGMFEEQCWTDQGGHTWNLGLRKNSVEFQRLFWKMFLKASQSTKE